MAKGKSDGDRDTRRPGPNYDGRTGGEGGTELIVGQSSTTMAALVATVE
jgi:hypothetical protein